MNKGNMLKAIAILETTTLKQGRGHFIRNGEYCAIGAILVEMGYEPESLDIPFYFSKDEPFLFGLFKRRTKASGFEIIEKKLGVPARTIYNLNDNDKSFVEIANELRKNYIDV